MEPDKRTVTPSEDGLGSLVFNDGAVRQGLSDNEPSPTATQSYDPPPQLETSSMSTESSFSDDPGHLTPSTTSEPPRENLPPGPSQPEEVMGTLGRDHTSHSTLVSVNPSGPLGSSTQGTSCGAGLKPGSGGRPAAPSKLYASETRPFPIPLPESDDEEQGPSLARAKPARSTLNSKTQDRGPYMTGTDEMVNTSGDPDPPNITRPSEMDDNQALWVLGDSVLARRDRRVHERWKAGLGITFVLANILSVLILCIALELYRRTKAAQPGLLSKIRARHIARVGKDSPFSPIISLFFEVDAPFIQSNRAFLAGLCTTLVCTLCSDLALRWVARYESRLPPRSATPRDRMVARMEWNECIERRAVPWAFEIGIPGMLYMALCCFYTGVIMRAYPHLSQVICATFGVLFTIISVAVLWYFEPALDARFRPNPVSSTRR
ncbi:hypothetical protein BC827DRAFT_908206 [Russula dissimulans]|nr:hypothetical protein BC827DRAFT_908206 [Russula dissimulans]